MSVGGWQIRGSGARSHSKTCLENKSQKINPNCLAWQEPRLGAQENPSPFCVWQSLVLGAAWRWLSLGFKKKCEGLTSCCAASPKSYSWLSNLILRPVLVNGLWVTSYPWPAVADTWADVAGWCRLSANLSAELSVPPPAWLFHLTCVAIPISAGLPCRKPQSSKCNFSTSLLPSSSPCVSNNHSFYSQMTFCLV